MLRRAVLLVVCIALTASCGGDDETGATTTVSATSSSAPATTVATTTTAATTTTTAAVQAIVDIVATNYEFAGIPPIVEAGNIFTLFNDSTDEVHSAFVIMLDDSDERTVEEFTALPYDQVIDHRGNSPLGTIITIKMALPGQSHYITEMERPLTEPGRYLVLCAVSVGADVNETYLHSVDGPPVQVEGVPAHFQVGEIAEFRVEG
jgi:hypothetical protein